MTSTFDPRRHVPAHREFDGRVVLVTGAGSGLGRTVKKLEAVHAEIGKLGAPEASIVPLDLERALAADYESVASAIEQRYGRLDGLLHNAALLGTLTPIEQYEVPLFMRVMHVNVTAAFVLTQYLLPLLKKSDDATVLFTSSGVGARGRAYWGAYAVSKFAVEGLTQVLAPELESTSNIRVNIIDPGKVRTHMRRAAYPSEDQNTLPAPESLTAPYLALLGPASRGVTGQRFNAQG
jgi:NAD(P)-dependent dehydrogenase (short-subunit alcohol dehydrogenase family)